MTDAPKMRAEHIEDVEAAADRAKNLAQRMARLGRSDEAEAYAASREAASLAEVAAFLRSHTDEP